MFTGIIEAAGKIESVNRTGTRATGDESARLRVAFEAGSEIARGMKLGDSIAVNGCCLTVIDFDSTHFAADLSGETLERTSFAEKKAGDVVNLERPLAAGARLGGHFVQGHVDGVGRVTRLAREGENWWLSIRVPDELRRYVAEKGSLAIDGISLTVARWHDAVTDIAIIPHTHQHTNVRGMLPGDAVNLETDILAKYVESLLETRNRPAQSRLTVSRLIEEGF